MKIDGACTCGNIRIEGEADPATTSICHCTDCQTATGTAFRVSIPVSGDELQGHRRADDLHQDHGGQRQSARAGVLRQMRLAALFDHAGRGAAGACTSCASES